MKKNNLFTILIADRNPHVRKLLKREIALEGYNVCLAKNNREVQAQLSPSPKIDLIILDPDIIDLDKSEFFEIIEKSMPTLPVIIHVFSRDDIDGDILQLAAAVVEKSGGSVDYLKQVTFQILRRDESYSMKPRRKTG